MDPIATPNSHQEKLSEINKKKIMEPYEFIVVHDSEDFIFFILHDSFFIFLSEFTQTYDFILTFSSHN